MHMPKPTKFHKKLEALVGNWTGDEVMYPSPMNPEGSMTTGTYTSRWVTDGFAVIQEYEQKTDGDVTFSGHGVFTYDPNEKCYLWYWFDSMGSVPATGTKGQWSGNKFVWHSESPMGHARYTHAFLRGGVCAFMIEYSEDGKKWALMMEGHYSKVGAAKSAKPAKKAAKKPAAKPAPKASKKGTKKAAKKPAKK